MERIDLTTEVPRLRNSVPSNHGAIINERDAHDSNEVLHMQHDLNDITNALRVQGSIQKDKVLVSEINWFVREFPVDDWSSWSDNEIPIETCFHGSKKARTDGYVTRLLLSNASQSHLTRSCLRHVKATAFANCLLCKRGARQRFIKMLKSTIAIT